MTNDHIIHIRLVRDLLSDSFGKGEIAWRRDLLKDITWEMERDPRRMVVDDRDRSLGGRRLRERSEDLP